ncbi:MAG: hypothetical protein IJT79_05675 [Ruminococcus sp.]|nr:hypothetical protein [Ruminococcus sp.]
MIAELRINGKPSPYVRAKETGNGVIYTGKLTTATILTTTQTTSVCRMIF